MQVTLGHIPTDEGSRLREEDEERMSGLGKGRSRSWQGYRVRHFRWIGFGSKTCQREVSGVGIVSHDFQEEASCLKAGFKQIQPFRASCNCLSRGMLYVPLGLRKRREGHSNIPSAMYLVPQMQRFWEGVHATSLALQFWSLLLRKRQGLDSHASPHRVISCGGITMALITVLDPYKDPKSHTMLSTPREGHRPCPSLNRL
jgi:hypothetical protein